jgi:uncharacterized protein YecT (DUF1311 family)
MKHVVPTEWSSFRKETSNRAVRCEEIEEQQPLNYCSGVRAKRTDRELNATYQALVADFPTQATALRNSERSWIRERDRVCDAKAKQYEGGTMEPQVHAECIYRRTRKRIQELTKLRQRWSQPPAPQAPRSP